MESLGGIDVGVEFVSWPQVIETIAAQSAIVSDGAGVEKDRTVTTDVRVSAIDEFCDQGDHVVDRFARAGVMVGRMDVEGGKVPVKGVFVVAGHRESSSALMLGLTQNSVLAIALALVDTSEAGVVGHMSHVCDVLDHRRVPAVQSREAGDEIRQQERPHIAHVGVAVHRGAARVQGEVTLSLRGDRFDRPRTSVVEPHGRHPRWLGAPRQSMAGSPRSGLSVGRWNRRNVRRPVSGDHAPRCVALSPVSGSSGHQRFEPEASGDLRHRIPVCGCQRQVVYRRMSRRLHLRGRSDALHPAG